MNFAAHTTIALASAHGRRAAAAAALLGLVVGVAQVSLADVAQEPALDPPQSPAGAAVPVVSPSPPEPLAPSELPSTPTPTPASTAPEPASLDAQAAFREFRQRFDAGGYATALPYAQRVLELAERSAKQPEAEEVQVALMNVARTQQLMDDNLAAEASYRRVIELIEASGRPLQARLARAHAGLGAAYQAEKRHELAVASFEQALGLTRRHEGLLSEQQVPLLEQYVDSLTALGRYQEALNAQRYVLRIATRRHGENGVGLAPTLESIGRWYAEVGAYDQSRRTLKRAIALIETAEGEESPKLVSPLSSLAACNRRQLIDPTQQLYDPQDPERAAMFHEPGIAPSSYSPAMLMGEAEKSLQRACRIAEARPDPSPVQIADVRTQLGDWYQARNQPDRALPNYRKAWEAALNVQGSVAQGKSLVEALFGQPVLLQIVRPDGWNRYAARPPEQVEIRNVVVGFTVGATGRVEAPKVVDDSGDAKRADKTVDALKDTAHYRPRLSDGEPVATPDMQFSQPWIVLLPTQEDAGETPPVEPAAPEAEKKAAERALPEPISTAAPGGNARP